jgi:hypothetical protein
MPLCTYKLEKCHAVSTPNPSLLCDYEASDTKRSWFSSRIDAGSRSTLTPARDGATAPEGMTIVRLLGAYFASAAIVMKGIEASWSSFRSLFALAGV